MIIRQLKEKQYEHFHHALVTKAHAAPLEACYTVNMNINGEGYAVKVQPERHNKMAVLHALRIINQDENGFTYELITNGAVLSSLLEILLYQCAAQ